LKATSASCRSVDKGLLLPYLLTIVIVFAASFARSALGFGDALIAMPLLVLVVGLRTAAPLVALVATTIAIVILWRNWQAVDFRVSWRLILASCLGIPIGLLLLTNISEQRMQAVLGVLLITFALYNLLQPRLVIRQDRWGLAYVFGFWAGVLGGAYNTVGPLLVVYGQLRRWSPVQFRVTLQSCFLPTYFVIVVGHGVKGLLTPDVFTLYSLALPIVFLAIYLGGRLNVRMSRERFTRGINIALMLMGAMLCIRSLSL
jgi:uncharacterized membrane protein YfcA